MRDFKLIYLSLSFPVFSWRPNNGNAHIEKDKQSRKKEAYQRSYWDWKVGWLSGTLKLRLVRRRSLGPLLLGFSVGRSGVFQFKSPFMGI